MEEFYKQQTERGEAIQAFIRNTKKDSFARKTKPSYFEEKLELLEYMWENFEKSHQELMDKLNNVPTEDDYFVTDYFSKMKTVVSNIVEDWKDHLAKIKLERQARQREEERVMIKPLVRKQSALLESLSRTLRQIVPEDKMTYKSVVDKLWIQIEEIHYEIHRLAENPAEAGYNIATFVAAENTMLKFCVAPAENVVIQSPPVLQSIQSLQLPKIPIPKFDGDYLKWQQFHDIYKKVVHESNASTIEKMWYLKSNLSGEAERLIRHLELTEANYNTAWSVLQERFNNKRVLVTAILAKLFDHPNVGNDAASIKNLHDNIFESLQALKNVGVNLESSDAVIMFHMTRKLDRFNHALYEQSLSNTRDLQEVKDFLSFLEQRFLTLEAIGKPRNENRSIEKPSPRKTCATASGTNSTLCAFCERAKHKLFQCEKFKIKSAAERLSWVQRHKLCVNCFKPDHMAKNCSWRGCFKCDKKHNTMLHLETGNQIPTSASAASAYGIGRKYTLLATAKVVVKGINERKGEFRALLDSGSQVNLVSERLVKKLSLKISETHVHINGVGGQPQISKARVSLVVRSRYNKFAMLVEAFVLPHIIGDQPTEQITQKVTLPDNIQLADPTFDKPGKIDMLLGADDHYAILLPERRRGNRNRPTLQNSEFGWIVAGRINMSTSASITCMVGMTNPEESLERFWQLDTLEPIKRYRSPEEEYCEKFFLDNLHTAADNRLIVKLPFAEEASSLGESREVAIRRFMSLERRMNPDIKKEYVKFMSEYEQLGHMKQVMVEQIPKNHYFIPHHCVLKPESTTTKLRVVFDASCKTSSGKSLNDILYPGPVVQSQLFSILLRFRTHKYVFTADIEKMYRQVWINPADQFNQMIVWREDPSQELKFYRLKTVTYGTTSAPYLATKCLEYLALKNIEKLSSGASALKNDFYVDDCLTGADSLPEALQIRQELLEILKPKGFNLRKWCSNSSQLLKEIPKEDTIADINLGDTLEQTSVKTLGIIGAPKEDQLCGKAQRHTKGITRRVVLSEVGQIFDPLGLFAPVVVRAKMFLQHVATERIEMDGDLPPYLEKQWEAYREDVQALNHMKIPRHIFDGKVPTTKELHTFVDASEKAYGAAVYVRSTYKNGQISVRLLCAKSRVAPLEKQTLPRLELCAAVLGAELTDRVRQDLQFGSESVESFLWSDSTVVLSWINSRASHFHTFVANRLTKIHAVSHPRQWRHVSSALNAADVLSRGISAAQLSTHTLWLYGPLFLHGPQRGWPAPFKPTEHTMDTAEKKTKVFSMVTATANKKSEWIYTVNHRNSFYRLQRIVAYVLRFCHKQNRKPTAQLELEELDQARRVIIKQIQETGFAYELRHLKKRPDQPLDRKSTVATLPLILDEDSIIRVATRLQQAPVSTETRNPYLLPYNDPVVKMMLRKLHEENLHCGHEALRGIARQQYHIIKVKPMVRNVIQGCVVCTKYRPQFFKQVMGDLPEHRVSQNRPFLNAGVDYCGPFWIHHKVRGKRPDKAYIAVFVCFATKAVHLELVGDLSTSSFVGALQRFIGRRGRCQTLYCDNATNFVGANNQLKELTDTIHSETAAGSIKEFCNQKGVQFKFIPPRSPHFGGLWEAAVKSAKHLLLKNVSTANLTFEQLSTIIVNVEAVLNSRPLTPNSDDPNDLTALTPGHLLIGEPLVAQPDAEPITQRSIPEQWELVQRLKHTFWTQWSQEYLQELQGTSKWKKPYNNVKEGMMVILKEDNVPILQWPIGRIVKLYPGLDGYVRVVDVKTARGTYKRAIHKLAPLLRETATKRKIEADDTESNSQKDPGIEDNAEPKTKRRLSIGLPPLAMTICLMLLLLPIAFAQRTNITRFNPKPGIYYESIGTGRMATSDWTIVAFYDLEPYWADLKTFSDGVVKVGEICVLMKVPEACTAMQRHFEHVNSELRTGNDLLHIERQRRSPLDIIGNIANGLFGVLDSKYATEMSGTIRKVKSNEDYLLNLLQNQTSVIDSTINIIKRDEATIENQMKLMEQQMNDMTKVQDNAVKALQWYITLTTQMTVIAGNLQRIQTEISRVFTDAHHSKISPLLLSPGQLREHLNQLKRHLPFGLDLPVPDNDVLQLYGLMKAQGTIANNHVIFKVTFPLVATQAVQLYNLVPIPAIGTHGIVIMNIKIPIIAVNKEQNQYIGLSRADLEQCHQLNNEQYICFDKQTTFSGNSNCEFQLFKNTKSSTCQIQHTNRSFVWYDMYHKNQWIFATTRPIELAVTCDDNIQDVTIKKTGLLTLDPTCTARSSAIRITGHRITTTDTMKLSYVRFGNFSIGPTKVAPTTTQFTKMQLSYDELSNIQGKLETKQNWKLPEDPSQPAHHVIVSYVALTIPLVLVMVYGIKRCSQPPRHNGPEQTTVRIVNPIPTPAAVSPAPSNFAVNVG